MTLMGPTLRNTSQTVHLKEILRQTDSNLETSSLIFDQKWFIE